MPTDPGTRKAGSLVLFYTMGSNQHSVAINGITGVDIQDVATIRPEAETFGDKLKACLTSVCTIQGWGLKDPSGFLGYTENFGTAKVGTINGGSGQFYSQTWTLSGRGVPTTVGGAAGKVKMVVFGGYAVPIIPGTKTFPVASHTGLIALTSWLHTNLRWWADFFGQHAEPKTYVTVQFNSRAQKRLGS